MKRTAWLPFAFFSLCETASAQVGDKVRIGAFLIDRTEVTVGRFQAHAAATGLVTEAERSGGGFEYDAGWERRPGWTVHRPFGVDPASTDEPAVHVTWMEASGFCQAAGGRLPTAAEWIAAAYTESRADPPVGFVRGQTYRYPVLKPADANTSLADPWPRAAPAGRTSAGVNGLYDMGGNVWEWVADARGEERRTMGGSWWYGPDQMESGVSAWKPAAFYAVYVGFRCAYDPAP